MIKANKMYLEIIYGNGKLDSINDNDLTILELSQIVIKQNRDIENLIEEIELEKNLSKHVQYEIYKGAFEYFLFVLGYAMLSFLINVFEGVSNETMVEIISYLRIMIFLYLLFKPLNEFRKRLWFKSHYQEYLKQWLKDNQRLVGRQFKEVDKIDIEEIEKLNEKLKEKYFLKRPRDINKILKSIY